MEQQPTVIQKLVAYLKQNPMRYQEVLGIIKDGDLIESERQQIVWAFNHGYNNGNLDTDMTGEEYYHKTFTP